MSYDYYAQLAGQHCELEELNEKNISRFIDKCCVSSCIPPQGCSKDDVRLHYMDRMKHIQKKKKQDCSKRDIQSYFTKLPFKTWLGIEVLFKLQRPWYSKDDDPFHVLDNPIRRDFVDLRPCMAASSWKGLLRWACRMLAVQMAHTQKLSIDEIDETKDPSWILHLFGNHRKEQRKFQEGALIFYPTFFDSVDFEMINPHSRVRKAGTQPIFYEVVPSEACGRLRLLYAPYPGRIAADDIQPLDAIQYLFRAIKLLLETYGISAKRTSGWGTARIEKWCGFLKTNDDNKKRDRATKTRTLKSLADLSQIKQTINENVAISDIEEKDLETFLIQLKESYTF